MTAPDPSRTTTDNERNTELLAHELPDARYVDAGYLHWLYDENPYGPAIQRGVDEDGVRVAHYALIPQRYRGPEGVVPAAFSLHAVTRSGTQRKGYFQQLGAEIYAEAADAGWQLVQRRLQRQVDRRGREVHGVEDSRTAAGQAVPPRVQGPPDREPPGRRRVPRRLPRSPRSPPASTTSRSTTTRTRTPPSTSGGASPARVPSTRSTPTTTSSPSAPATRASASAPR